MGNTQAATAVAPTTSKNATAIKAVFTTTSILHTGITAAANIVMYGGARIINKLDDTITVQDTVDKVTGITEERLADFNLKMSGYKGYAKK
jgi:hypothetical protein